ncbi:MAG: endonuclease [Bacteroidaceae bacterium]|nr:endonuclease [Bacteroidaceae bacterium]
MKRLLLFLIVCTLIPLTLCSQQSMTVMFMNTENLFDPEDDPLKDDDDYTPDGDYHWTKSRYWDKLDAVSKVIVAADEDQAPALVGLCEVENETVLKDLTSRSALREAGYRFVMTDSPDRRGIDVALMYRRTFFRLIGQESLRVNLKPYGGGATRDILHVTGVLDNHDTIDVYVCHWPSRYGGVEQSEPLRISAARRLRASADSVISVRRKPYIIIMGDLNEGPDDPAVRDVLAAGHELVTVMDKVDGGSYKYDGEWDKYDQFILSESFTNGLGCTELLGAEFMDLPFLLTDDDSYGGRKPFRTYNGRRYQGGYSDHLPIKMSIGF